MATNNLSLEEQAKKKEMDEESFFASYRWNIEIAFSAGEKERTQKRLEPYVLLLKDYIMESIRPKRDALYEALRDSCYSAKSKRQVQVPIFSFHNISWKQRYEDAKREGNIGLSYEMRRKSHCEGWNWTISTEREYEDYRPYFGAPHSVCATETFTETTRMPESIKKIVSNTDFLDLLAAEFGSCFTIKREVEELHTFENFSVVKTTLMLSYVHSGVHPEKLRSMLKAQEKYKSVEKPVLGKYEWVTIWRGSAAAEEEEAQRKKHEENAKFWAQIYRDGVD